MRVLGALLAGGKSSRFGSDKAEALFEGERLIDRMATRLRAQCEAVILCGRHEASRISIPDRPEAGLGPLGGLNAALTYARDDGFSHVLSAGCDIPNLPEDLVEALAGEGAGIVQSQPVVGLWPTDLAPQLDKFVSDGGRALYGFAEAVGARMVRFDPPLMNVNRPEDLPG